MGSYYAISPPPAYRSLMIFIDGGYLRSIFNRLFGHEKIDFGKLSRWLGDAAGERIGGRIACELVRVYYYDAIVDRKEEEERYVSQKTYFDAIEELPYFEVRLGRLIRYGDGKFRQKGVDVFLAADMINKAHLDHYDIGLLLAGDDDYLDLVKTVKELCGKRIFGAYEPSSTSRRLIKSLDQRIELTKDYLEMFIKP